VLLRTTKHNCTTFKFKLRIFAREVSTSTVSIHISLDLLKKRTVRIMRMNSKNKSSKEVGRKWLTKYEPK
jgi:hypothetical protein